MVYQNLLIIALFILVYSLISKKIEKTALSGPLLAVIIGIVCGPLFLNLINFKLGSEEFRTIAELALALVLFTDASNTNFKTLKSNLTIPSRLLMIGLPLTILFGVLGGYMVFDGLTWIELGILATMLAPTDAALGKAVVTNPAVPIKVKESLNVESGLNDGISVPVLFLLIAFYGAQTGAGVEFPFGLVLFIEQIGLGLLAGIAITYAINWLINFSIKYSWISESWKTMVIITLAISCFTAAQIIGGSGFIACFVGGLFYSANKTNKVDLLEAGEGVGDTMSMLTWIIFGSVVVGHNLENFSWDILLYALLSLTIIRIVPVLLSLSKTDLSIKEKLFIGWFGPRGLATIVFAIIVLDVNLPSQQVIISTVSYTILLSVVLHGFTANSFIKLLNKE